jgi:glucans biosynthesis protein C
LPEVKWTANLEALYEFLNTSYSWSALVALFGYASRYLNRPSALLSYATRAVYPFYILHQSVIISLAYPMTNWAWSPELKFLCLALGTFGLCWALYEFLIKRWKLTRLVFGVNG